MTDAQCQDATFIAICVLAGSVIGATWSLLTQER